MWAILVVTLDGRPLLWIGESGLLFDGSRPVSKVQETTFTNGYQRWGENP